MQENIGPRLIEVAFTLFIDRLFTAYTQPVLVFRYLDASAQLFGIDRKNFQILLVKVMKEDRVMKRQVEEYIKLLKKSGATPTELVSRSGLNIRTAWRIYRKTVGEPSLVLQYSSEERALMTQFLTQARRIGGML